MSPGKLRQLLSRANPRSAGAIRQQLDVPRKSRIADKSSRQKLERKFDDAWATVGGMELEKEVQVIKGRRWRWDRCHRASRVLIEVQGATFANGAHSRGTGYAKDREKNVSAAEQGWLVYELTAKQITTDWARRILANIESRLRKCA